MAEFERTRVREREAPVQNDYEMAIQRYSERAERNATGRIVCKLADCPQMLTRQGRLRYYLGLSIKDTPLQDWIVFTHEIRTVSGKHRHQGGLVIYVIEGRGYSVVDGERCDWETWCCCQCAKKASSISISTAIQKSLRCGWRSSTRAFRNMSRPK
jgi:hypothetical protein